jgi:Mce-associated membrane protein
VEDQQPDPGDLTTETAETADATASEEAPVAAASEESVEPAAATRRRRWFALRRRAKTPEPVTDSGTSDVAEPDKAEPAPRTPVGKAGRTAKAQAPVDEPIEAPADEPTEAAEPETSDATEAPADEPEAAEPEASDEPIMVPHRPAGKRLTIAAVAAGILFVAAAGFAGATVQPYLAERATVDTKLDVARTAADAISTLWTYTPDNMESLPDRSARYLGGDFAHEYRKYIDAIVAPNKQAQVTNTTQVMGAAVETLTPSEATAIVYTNSVATSPVTKNIPSLRYLSYRLTMERRDAKWLITRMATVTSLDLTPQL